MAIIRDRALTVEQDKISRKNNRLARIRLGIYGNHSLVLHHKDLSLRHNDIERYIQWNIEDLEILTRSEHTKLHNQGQKRPVEWVNNQISSHSFPVICIETGEMFSSSHDVERKLNISSCNVSRVCNGIRKSAGGLHFIWGGRL